MNKKVFIIGFPKSGTTSFTSYFKQNGYIIAHQKVKEGYVGKLIYKAFFENKKLLHYLKKYDVFTQLDVCYPRQKLNYWPQFELIPLIKKQYPDSIFILNKRNIKNIIISIKKWKNKKEGSFHKRLISSNILNLPSGCGKTDEELKNWINLHYNNMDLLFKDYKKYIVFDIKNDNIIKLNNIFGNKVLKFPYLNKSK